MKKENCNRGDKKPRIIVVPHYIGTEKADNAIKKIIAEEIRKNIKKSA